MVGLGVRTGIANRTQRNRGSNEGQERGNSVEQKGWVGVRTGDFQMNMEYGDQERGNSEEQKGWVKGQDREYPDKH